MKTGWWSMTNERKRQGKRILDQNGEAMG
jgi:hypothetical protein